MSDHPLRKVRTTWIVVAIGVAIWTVLMLIVPDQPLKSADTWSFVGIFWIGVLVMLPVVGIALLITIYTLVDHALQKRRARIASTAKGI